MRGATATCSTWGFHKWHDALARFENESWAATWLYLVYLSTWRDSLIERKFGTANRADGIRAGTRASLAIWQQTTVAYSEVGAGAGIQSRAAQFVIPRQQARLKSSKSEYEASCE